MEKRKIKKKIYQDEITMLEPQDDISSPKRKRPSKKFKNQQSDDSFQCGERKIVKKQQKPATKEVEKHATKKQATKKNQQLQKVQSQKEEVCYIENINTQYIIKYVDTKKVKIEKERKIFNPDQYFQHIQMKMDYQSRLAKIYEQYGRILTKQPQPKSIVSKWQHLIKHVEEVGKQRLQERQQKPRLAKKVARYAQMTYNKIQTLQQQKQKQQERKVRKTASTVWKLVQKDYWRNVMRVKKFLDGQEIKRSQRQIQTKRLQQLVQKQLEVSNKISQLLQGIDQVQLNNLRVSNNVVPPIIINIKLNPCQYIGLQEDRTIRQPLLIKNTLRQYQIIGMHWIHTLHNKKMNGILADEMGLGKTIQTISFLAQLALSKGIWGPHLVIVPTSIIVNWQIEFKRWCPAFKIMTYYGSPKQRKLKRKGWSKLNSFHVCITSYKIVVTDQAIFKRKKWYYMILDEAQNIKNYKSQRWQVLLNFNTKFRLLLTGTPLQNDISQLWSLLHFLMPKLFTSFKDFNQWFNIPFQQALQKNFPISQEILKKLHTILRPFFLRRLKKDVQKQLPQKTEVIIRCPLSRRQKYLYDEFISHQNKRSPQLMGMMNILMQLKKVCNHPDLFLPRTQQSPLNWPRINFVISSHVFLNINKVGSLYRNEELKILYEDLAQTLIYQFEKLKLNKYNQQYYIQQYRIKLYFLKVNYERSCKKQLALFNSQLYSSFLINQKIIPSKSIEERIKQFDFHFENFIIAIPKIITRTHQLVLSQFSSSYHSELRLLNKYAPMIMKKVSVFYPIQSRLQLHFPEKNILLYDSGKLIKMVGLLKMIKDKGQKVLIFTQMTKMLDIFQKIMNMHKFNYVRLDGGTKTQVRQQLVQRFNNDSRVLCFISSTRSGGIGLNLTGASNVIFYDTDWNPAMDRQAQDRCHRIGQTRNVTIYRLISQHTIQENILMKSIQKRKLDQLVTEDGMFNTKYFQKVNIRDMLQGVIGGNQVLEGDLAEVEDNQDRQMLKQAQKQGNQMNDFAKDQQIQTESFPDLFNYGLNIVKQTGVQQQSQKSEIEIQQQQQMEQQEISGNDMDQQKDMVEKKQEISEKQEFVNTHQQEEHNSLKMSDIERFSGIITYQKHYNYIQKNFYS